MTQTIPPPTRRPGGPARWVAGIGRWFDYNFTRENLIQIAKTLASVGPLTILIWVYAEREQVRKQPDVSISIEVRCNDPRRVVSLQKPYPDKVIVAELEGPPSTLDSVVERLERRTGEEPAVEIAVDPLLQPGMVHEIDTKQALGENPLFRGITIDSCEPAKLEVAVDEFKEADAEVQAPPGITNLVGVPVFTPRTVKVRGPKAAIDALIASHKLIAEADLGSFDAMNVPGPHDFSVVRIKPLDDPSLTFNPPNVEAAVSVRESDAQGTIRSVPIWVYGPPEVMARYRVELVNPVLTNVKVSGPNDKIILVNSPDFFPKPHALLEIHDDDEPGKSLQRTVSFDLSDLGLHVNDEIRQHKIDFRLVDLHGNE